MSATSPPGVLRGLPDPGEPGESVEALRLRMAELCAGAVDTFEVAAALEADGINDEAAGRYGHPHVFALARDLYERTDRRPAVPAPPPDPWGGQVWRHLLRGVLFGLPGLCYVTVAPAAAGPGAGIVVLLSLLLSWSASQGVAYLAYVRLGQSDRPAAMRVLRRGVTAAGLAGPPLIALAGVLLGAGTPATALAVGQCVYLLAATVALVSGAELRLLAALLPGAAASTAQLAGAQIRPLVWAAWAVTIAATAGIALARTAGSGTARRDPMGIGAALPYALFGLLAGGLLTFPTVSALFGLARPSPATAVAVLALSLSMGFAEWILLAYRRRLHRELRARGALDSFARAARAALAVAVAAYLSALSCLAVAVTVPYGLIAGDLGEQLPWIAGAHLCLGGAFFVALLLQSCGRIRAVLIACATALTAEAAGLRTEDPRVVQCAVACALLCALCGYAFVVLSRATSHR